MGQFETEDFLIVPLSPIHVGGGDEAKLGLENYRVRGDQLERVNLRRLLLQENMAGMNLQGAFQQQSFDRLREKAEPEDIEERIRLAPASANELSKGSSPALRQGRVDGFQRSGGKPVLPGSSIKGAFRTAWLAHCSDPSTRVRSHNDLVEQSFALPRSNDTDADPFRDVFVSDTVIPAGSTQIDQIFAWKKDRDGGWSRQNTGQMHWELLRSVANGGRPPLLELRIGVRNSDVRQRRRQLDASKAPSRSPTSLDALLDAVNAHHFPIWQEDLRRFFKKNDQRLLRSFKLLEHFLSNDNRGGALVRIGRGGHAESKSIKSFRKIAIRNPKTRETRSADYGTTRQIVSVGNEPVTLGWALLVRKAAWKAPSAWLPEPASSVDASNQSNTERPITQQTVLYRKGQRVLLADGESATMLEDLTQGMKDVRVDIAGDTEVVSADEIERAK